MPKPRRGHARSETRRAQIIQAALACFAEDGYTDTTMEDIRRRSQASNGSIYHHFRSKELLAEAVYLQGLIDYQTGLLAALERHRVARDGVSAIVRYHLRWTTEHAAWAGYLTHMRHTDVIATTEPAIAAQNAHFVERVLAWFAPHMEAGAVRRLAPDLLIPLISGPCQDYARLWLRGRTRTPLAAATEQFAQAAWEAVRAPAAG